MFDQREVSFAAELLRRYGYQGVRTLIGFSIAKAEETHFEMRYVSAIKQYVPDWQRVAVRRGEINEAA